MEQQQLQQEQQEQEQQEQEQQRLQAVHEREAAARARVDALHQQQRALEEERAAEEKQREQEKCTAELAALESKVLLELEEEPSRKKQTRLSLLSQVKEIIPKEDSRRHVFYCKRKQNFCCNRRRAFCCKRRQACSCNRSQVDTSGVWGLDQTHRICRNGSDQGKPISEVGFVDRH